MLQSITKIVCQSTNQLIFAAFRYEVDLTSILIKLKKVLRRGWKVSEVVKRFCYDVVDCFEKQT